MLRSRERLIGRDERLAAQILLGGMTLLSILLVLQFTTEFGYWVSQGNRMVIIILTAGIVSTIASYVNDGFLVSLAVAMMIHFGAAPDSLFSTFGGLLETLKWYSINAIVFGIPVGVLSYVLGRGARRVDVSINRRSESQQ